MASWNRIARRIRVPLGFAFAVLFLWLAEPTPMFLLLGLVLVVPGLLLRGYASGYVKKNRELTTTGPYAHTRNPLYLGSMMIAFGFALTARSVWIAAILVVLFVAIYVPVIRSEEEYLRSVFPDFDVYAASVPRLLPRMVAAAGSGAARRVFSAALYRKHREYQALLGAAGMYAALILKLLTAAGILLGFCAATGQTSQSALPLIPPRAGYNYPANETLTYAVDWRVFPAGTTVMHLQQDGDQERLSASGDTLGAINLIYRVSDRFQSSFNRRTGCSAGFAKQLQEGRRQVTTDLKFDYAQGKALLNEKNLVKGTSMHSEASVGPCVTDLLSAIFYPAAQTLTPGQSFLVPVADAMHTVTVTMHVEARETVRVPLGTYPTIRVQPTAAAGMVKARGNIWIWYTDDERHIPVQMRARLFWGTITFRLTALDQK